MASPSSSLYLVLFFFLPALAISSSHYHHNKKLKSMHFTIYMQDALNKTDFLIYPGIGKQVYTPIAAPLGSMYAVVKDPLTVSPDPKSKVVGFLEVITITNSLDGQNSMSISKATLDIEGHKGSITVVGSQSNFKATDAPICGGTGDFMFAQGYLTTSLVSHKPDLSFVFKVEVHLFWPPYATQY